MSDRLAESISTFTITRSGFLHATRLGLHMKDHSQKSYVRRAVILAIITWLPLLILSLIQQLAFGDQVQISFLEDFATHARFLVVIPLLIMAERAVDNRLQHLTTRFYSHGILDKASVDKYNTIKENIARLSASRLASVVIFVVIVLNVVIRLWMAREHQVSIWIFNPSPGNSTFSWAGIFFSVVSLPLLQLLILQWLWRWILSMVYFSNLTQLGFALNPAHPDRAGGMGFVGTPPGPFMVVAFSFAVLFSATVSQNIIYLGKSLPDYYIVMAVFAFLSIVLNVFPLLVFYPALSERRKSGIIQYSTLIHEHHRQFDEQWLGRPISENIRGFSDASSLADLNASYDAVTRMRKFPFDVKIMMSSIIIAMLPLLPLLAFEFNIVDVLKEVISLLL